MPPRKYHSITDIVATVYCEQKLVFDRTHGRATPLSVRAKAAAGTFEHLRFQAEGQTRAAFDKRCFIATQVYGGDARETQFLRAWRDQVLLRCPAGRLLAMIYYQVSPWLIPVLRRVPLLERLVRRGLDTLLRRLGLPR